MSLLPWVLRVGESKRKFCGTTTCNECPFLKDVPVGRFPPERFQQLRRTAQQGFNPIFACHKTIEGSDNACVGYLLVDGLNNFNVRLALSRKRFNPSELKATGPLYDSYKEMEDANDLDAVDWGDQRDDDGNPA